MNPTVKNKSSIKRPENISHKYHKFRDIDHLWVNEWMCEWDREWTALNDASDERSAASMSLCSSVSWFWISFYGDTVVEMIVSG